MSSGDGRGRPITMLFAVEQRKASRARPRHAAEKYSGRRGERVQHLSYLRRYRPGRPFQIIAALAGDFENRTFA